MPKFAFTGRQVSSEFPSMGRHGLGNGLAVFGISWFVGIVVGSPVAQGISGVPLVLILGRWVSALCHFKLWFVAAYGIFREGWSFCCLPNGTSHLWGFAKFRSGVSR